MKLCIPVKSNTGLQADVEPHLPDAETLLVFDTDSRTYHYLDVSNSKASEESTLIHALLCGSINRHALRSLIDQGIAVYGTEAQTVTEAIRQFEAGELEAVQIAGRSGHHHGQGGCQGHAGEAHAEHTCCGGAGHGEGEHECCGGGNHEEGHECCGGANHGTCETRAQRLQANA